MKMIRKTVIFLGILVALLAPVGVQTANAAITLLPKAADGTDCNYLLNQFEMNRLIPSTSSAEVNKQQNAYDEATAEQNKLFTPDNISACETDRSADVCGKMDAASKKVNDAQEALNKAAEANDPNAVNPPDERANLLGCAITTGRVSLGMIPYFISYITNFLLAIISLICVLFIVIGGYGYIYGGLTENKEKGKKTIMHALMGVGVASLAWVIVNVIMAAVTS